MKKILPCAGFLFLLTLASFAQHKIDFPEEFFQTLDRAQVEFIHPLDSDYRDIRPRQNDIIETDLAIYSRREKLQIRYHIQPEIDLQYTHAPPPHVRCIRLLLHLATNDQRFVMTGLDVDQEKLREQFNADWGKVFFFTPKDSFSSQENCKMLALYREGMGMAYVFFLFDDAGRELDNRFYALRFQDEDLQK
ncbi:MAG: hypothetical protein R3350_09860 [Saprospiraceae bacterium]|nr:hypothetical protein [Saprospiraceae bacterium]